MRLIDADAFIQMMEEKCDPESTLDPWVLSVCRGGVKMMPTVDAVPVRHGRWITNKYNQTVCSECTAPALEVETGCLMNRHLEPYKTHFCPNCGAHMDGKGNSDETD